MLNLSKFKITHKGLYWGLIITFAILYLCVGFVSTLHSITFFNLANSMWLAVLLGLTYEVGQASVLFSILMTKNKERFLPWALMILLTALQVTANVYASFKFMVSGGSMDWQYWQKSILFGVQASSPEMYQVIISWISGALLPVVALGMTALVAENIKMMTDEGEKEEQEKKDLASIGVISGEDAENFVRKMEENNQKFYERQSQNKPNFDLPKAGEVLDFQSPGISTKEADADYLDEEVSNMTPDWRVREDGTLNLDHQKFVDELSEKNEKLISDPETPQLKAVLTEEKVQDLNEDVAKEVSAQFEKDFVIPKKKAGRPPKNEKKVAVSKKAKEPLQKEEVKVPKTKRHRVTNPLTKKDKKPQVIKRIEQINTPSPGEELIHRLEEEPIVAPEPVKEPEPLKEFKDNIEVVDVKAIPVKKN